MTGWRIGYMAGPKWIAKTCEKLQGQYTSGACSISQAAAMAALQGPQELLVSQRAVYLQRRDQVVKALNDIDLISCPTPDGAFYIFASCERAIGQTMPDGTAIENDMDFFTYLLESEDVVVVPGSTFGLPGHFRLSFASSSADLQEGCLRIKRACEALEL